MVKIDPANWNASSPPANPPGYLSVTSDPEVLSRQDYNFIYMPGFTNEASYPTPITPFRWEPENSEILDAEWR